jgi:osmotically-inducible protein OsmY
MSDDEMRSRVVAELTADPRVDTGTFEVSAADGTVTLRGTVTSLPLKRAAAAAVARVGGVARIANELRAQLPAADRRTDEDVRGDVLEALMLDTSVPMTVDAGVRNGFVTLTGTVHWNYQREAAESRTVHVPGVAGIDNAIRLTQIPGSRAAGDAISAAFRRNALLRTAVLSVETSAGGVVTVSGAVSSWAAHDQAVAAVWCVPGVTEVDDRIRVDP